MVAFVKQPTSRRVLKKLLPCSFNAEEHPLYIKLLKDLQDVHSDDEEPAEEDDDLQIDRSNKSLARNLKCPLSGLEVPPF